MKRRLLIIGTGLLTAAVFLSACGASPTPVQLPTRTPRPTFTPTPDWTPTPAIAPTETPTAEPTAVPTSTESPKPVAVVSSDTMNVRTGPGTAYPLVGRASRGQRYDITGKNEAGDWFQVCCVASKQGWVSRDLVEVQGDIANLPVVTGIAPPPAPPTRVPRPTSPPVPTSPPAPVPTAAPSFPYRLGNTRCFPNAGITYIEGKVLSRGGPGKNGVTVAFSYASDGPIVGSYVTGTDAGKVGGYTHVLQHDGPREGNWFIWVVDGGRRISPVAQVRTDGVAGDGKCQQAVIDFVEN